MRAPDHHLLPVIEGLCERLKRVSPEHRAFFEAFEQRIHRVDTKGNLVIDCHNVKVPTFDAPAEGDATPPPDVDTIGPLLDALAYLYTSLHQTSSVRFQLAKLKLNKLVSIVDFVWEGNPLMTCDWSCRVKLRIKKVLWYSATAVIRPAILPDLLKAPQKNIGQLFPGVSNAPFRTILKKLVAPKKDEPLLEPLYPFTEGLPPLEHLLAPSSLRNLAAALYALDRGSNIKVLDRVVEQTTKKTSIMEFQARSSSHLQQVLNAAVEGSGCLEALRLLASTPASAPTRTMSFTTLVEGEAVVQRRGDGGSGASFSPPSQGPEDDLALGAHDAAAPVEDDLALGAYDAAAPVAETSMTRMVTPTRSGSPFSQVEDRSLPRAAIPPTTSPDEHAATASRLDAGGAERLASPCCSSPTPRVPEHADAPPPHAVPRPHPPPMESSGAPAPSDHLGSPPRASPAASAPRAGGEGASASHARLMVDIPIRPPVSPTVCAIRDGRFLTRGTSPTAGMRYVEPKKTGGHPPSGRGVARPHRPPPKRARVGWGLLMLPCYLAPLGLLWALGMDSTYVVGAAITVVALFLMVWGRIQWDQHSSQQTVDKLVHNPSGNPLNTQSATRCSPQPSQVLPAQPPAYPQRQPQKK